MGAGCIKGNGGSSRVLGARCVDSGVQGATEVVCSREDDSGREKALWTLRAVEVPKLLSSGLSKGGWKARLLQVVP